MTLRRQQRIQANPQRILDQRRYDSVEDVAVDYQTGIKINLDQIWPEMVVDHEVKSEQLKVVFLSLTVQIQVTSFNHIQHNCLHLLGNSVHTVALAGKAIV